MMQLVTNSVSYLAAMSPLEKMSWETGRGWREFTEGAQYWLRRLLEMPALKQIDQPDWLEPIVIWIAQGFAILLGLALLYGLARFAWPWLKRWFWGEFAPADNIRQTAIARPRPVQEWLEQARLLQAQEDYAGACRALYMALLIRMEEGGWLRQDPARTDREYLQRLEALWALEQRPIFLKDAWHQIFQTHEQLYYGGRPIPQETFQRCQSAYQDLEPELIRQPATL
jgi:hypothetical protein